MACTALALLTTQSSRIAAWLASQPYPPSDAASVARWEVEQLLCKATGWSRTRLLTELSGMLEDHVVTTVTAWVDARLHGEPLQYLLGEAPFRGRLFVVRPGCLIPRPETELLVECATEWVRQRSRTAFVLDLGTGSGCIAISVALECRGARVLSVDVSAEALSIAAENAMRHGLNVCRWAGSDRGAGAEGRPGDVNGPHRLTLISGDGLDWLRQAASSGLQQTMSPNGELGPTPMLPKINLLVSNPPYIPTADVAELAGEVRDHEPWVALDGGPDGLMFYRGISEIGPGFFAPGPAAFFFEVGAGQSADVLALFGASDCWTDWTLGVEYDLRGIDRVVWGKRPCSG